MEQKCRKNFEKKNSKKKLEYYATREESERFLPSVKSIDT